jgi:hypothetical protein
MLVTFHLADVVDGVPMRPLPSIDARLTSLSPSVAQMLERLRLLWRGTPQTGGHGSPERPHVERRVAIDHGIVTANLVLGDIVLEVKAGALFAQAGRQIVDVDRQSISTAGNRGAIPLFRCG